jgi:hypothetical protein
LELVLIRIFIWSVPPSTWLVIFTLLAPVWAAGVGGLGIRLLPVVVAVCQVLGRNGVRAGYPVVFERFLAAQDPVRLAVSAALIAPLGFALGMPFPLGILWAERHSQSAIAWGWGLNGLFTVIGSLASVLLGIAVGFQATILVALGLYGLAFIAFAGLRAAPAAAPALPPRP